MNKEITLEQLASYETAFDGDRANRIAMDAATKNGVNNAASQMLDGLAEIGRAHV